MIWLKFYYPLIKKQNNIYKVDKCNKNNIEFS